MKATLERSELVELLTRVQGEYREMPGLNLTVAEAERLWRLDRNTCAFVLATLSERRVLRRTKDGTYLRGPAD
jgi:predicted transcriptional regulator of viral defense system